MRHPPYHLRPNKAVDRLLLLEALRRVERMESLSSYTYYGLGGPYLEEFRLLYEFCPKMNLVSIESDQDTYKRQKFHMPCDTLCLIKDEFKSFLAKYEPRDNKSIFWLDYTGLTYGDFEDFMRVLSKVSANSIVKISLRAEAKDYFEKEEAFRARFDAVLPAGSASPPRVFKDYAALLQRMLRVAAQRALPSGMDHMFQPLSSFFYSDGTGMMTLTGVVCRCEDAPRFRAQFKDWPFANLAWGPPKQIDVPILSTKERLHLDRHLPCDKYAGPRLVKQLGYLVDRDRKQSSAKMKQYADFHRYSPYFVRAVP